MAYVARLGAWVTVVLVQFLPMFPQAGAFGNEAYDETWCLWPWWFSKGVQGPPREIVNRVGTCSVEANFGGTSTILRKDYPRALQLMLSFVPLNLTRPTKNFTSHGRYSL